MFLRINKDRFLVFKIEHQIEFYVYGNTTKSVFRVIISIGAETFVCLPFFAVSNCLDTLLSKPFLLCLECPLTSCIVLSFFI